MEKEKQISLRFRVKFEQLEKVNEEFSLVKIWVCTHGKNRNLSYISKDEIENALPTLAYCPVVAHLFKKEDGSYSIGGHDAELVIEDHGIDIHDLTVPFGVVVEGSYSYETVIEYGQEVEYLTAHAYLWTGRYPNLEKTIYSDDCWFNQSMEINFKNSRPYAGDSNYTEILGMSFSALCLLQKSDAMDENIEPCFISSRVEPVKFRLDEEFTKVFREMKASLSFCLNKKETRKGGNNKLTQEKINEILTEYELAIEDLDFETSDNMEETEFQSKLDELKKKRGKCSKIEMFAATYQQKREALQNACDPVIVRNKDGDIVSSTYYWVQDFDEVFVYVEKNVYADTNYECTNGRISYSFDDKSKTAQLTSEFELMILTRLTAEENQKIEDERNAAAAVSAEFELYKASHSVKDTEADELRKFKKERLDAEREAREAELFSRFDEKLNGDTEYEALKADCGDLTLDEISDKCFSLFGRKTATFAVAKPKSSTVKLPVAADDGGTTTPYGDVYEKYLK